VVHAGVIMPLIPFEETSEEQWWKELRISLGGIINSTRVAWDIMKDQGGGHVIGIASGSSFRGYKNEVIYCAGKHGVEGFVKAVSLEAVPYGIALNAVGPGKRIKPTGLSLEQLEQTPNAVKSAWTDPADLGKAFVWLASQPSDRYSGLRFDAGPIIDTIAAEGWNFKFSPNKVTMYPDDISYRLEWQHHYDELEG
jgi:NAD(P)-dependent dehydrogenase (short-subunit alcohol dehydrogenase family)